MILEVSRLSWQIWLGASHVVADSWGLNCWAFLSSPLSLALLFFRSSSLPSVSMVPLVWPQVVGLFILWLKRKFSKRQGRSYMVFET